ncbi:hypothetical protein H9P43_003183 [Blastocladiella emersonii ATCC 22665]|nr:hypothetical protein H9P43_003183 [Blastocladiella emersonii ATCC 22665]
MTTKRILLILALLSVLAHVAQASPVHLRRRQTSSSTGATATVTQTATATDDQPLWTVTWLPGSTNVDGGDDDALPPITLVPPTPTGTGTGTDDEVGGEIQGFPVDPTGAGGSIAVVPITTGDASGDEAGGEIQGFPVDGTIAGGILNNGTIPVVDDGKAGGGIQGFPIGTPTTIPEDIFDQILSSLIPSATETGTDLPDPTSLPTPTGTAADAGSIAAVIDTLQGLGIAVGRPASGGNASAGGNGGAVEKPRAMSVLVDMIQPGLWRFASGCTAVPNVCYSAATPRTNPHLGKTSHTYYAAKNTTSGSLNTTTGVTSYTYRAALGNASIPYPAIKPRSLRAWSLEVNATLPTDAGVVPLIKLAVGPVVLDLVDPALSRATVAADPATLREAIFAAAGQAKRAALGDEVSVLVSGSLDTNAVTIVQRGVAQYLAALPDQTKFNLYAGLHLAPSVDKHANWTGPVLGNGDDEPWTVASHALNVTSVKFRAFY